MTDAQQAPLARSLQHIPIENLVPSKLNVRRTDARKVDDLVGSLEALGILQSLLVRPLSEPEGHYEIHAGRRRYLAAKKLHSEGNHEFEQLPCIVMQPGDDVTAIEASLAENLQRLPMDEMDQYEAFKRLADQGRTTDEIASHFAISNRLVECRLAIARLLPDIRRLYRKGEVDAPTIRLLTLATKERQKAWLATISDPEQNAPLLWKLRQWILGGSEIPVNAALFDVAAYDAPITRDLFAEDARHGQAFFTDQEEFWRRQNEAIDALAHEYRERGWKVHVIQPDERFQSWDWQKASKQDGGQIIIDVQPNGHVETHQGMIHKDQLRKQAAAAASSTDETVTSKPNDRPELSGPLANYLDLVRLSAVRVALAKKPKLALRLMLAHVIGSTGHWRVSPDPMRAASNAIDITIQDSPDVKAFEAIRSEIAALLDMEDRNTITGQLDHDGEITEQIFKKLCDLSDAQVNKIIAYVMAECLMCGTAIVDTIGTELNVTPDWSADGNHLFWSLVRDKEVIRAILGEVCTKNAERTYRTATGTKQKEIIITAKDESGAKVMHEWMPGWLKYPQAQYTERHLKAA